jgi:hypothetical protein
VDHYEMKAAVERALGTQMSQVATRATGHHIPTIVHKLPMSHTTATSDLIQRLNDQHAVRCDPICKEAAEVIQSMSAQLQGNLAETQRAVFIMSALHASLGKIMRSGRDFPWGYAGSGELQEFDDAMTAYENFRLTYGTYE